ncbi:MAG: cob(I)yrinic acid a,c-diamide adenosyltransferase [Phycisphaerae bacterium]
MAIYTRVGDAGETKRIDGADIGKDDPRVHAVGSTDELNCQIGLALAAARAEDLPDIAPILQPVQSELFALGSNLASVQTNMAIPLTIDPDSIERMEKQVDAAFEIAGPLSHFILPGGCMTACHLHVARATCRRAERWLVSFARTVKLEPLALKYINRLSDLLFALTRQANAQSGIQETQWSRDSMKDR